MFSEPGKLEIFQEELFNLRTPACLEQFEAFTDERLGGLSKAQLRHSTDEGKPEGCLVFEGTFNGQVPANALANVHSLGQACFGSKVRVMHDCIIACYVMACNLATSLNRTR